MMNHCVPVESELVILVVDLDDFTLGKYSCVYADIVVVLSKPLDEDKLRVGLANIAWNSVA